MLLKLVLGLGNPGAQYAGNRHNVGALFAAALCEKHAASFNFSKKLHAHIATIALDTVYRIAMPNTFMNLSGDAVVACANFYQITAENILVIHDELDLPLGRYQFKFGGGHAGHNGLRDIIQKLGTADFWRLRLGIGRPEFKTMVADYVLSNPPPAEQKILDEMRDLAMTELLQSLR